MRIRTVLLLTFVIFVAGFLALNWNELLRPGMVHLGIIQIEAPLGLVMFGLLLTTSVLFGVYAVSLQATALFEIRSYNKEMKAQKELVEKAETSRFTELRTMMERIEKDMQERHVQAQQTLQQQLIQTQKDLHQTIEQSSNTLAAYMGELEDRMERSTQKPTEP